MTDLITIPITDGDKGKRLDKILSARLADMSRSRLQALIKGGCVTLADQKEAQNSTISPSHKVQPGEIYTVHIPEPEDAIPQAENIPLEIIYEDDHLIVVNKPAGLVVHPAPGSPTGTLVNALLHHCGDSLSGIGGVKRPGIVHRIDKETSGLLVMAKHDKAHTGLSQQFADHSITRLYSAICKGHPTPATGRIEGNIGRHPVDRKKMAVVDTGGKWAATHYRTQEYYQAGGHALAALIECQLETGRTHQVRVHMAHIGHALVGDPVYTRGKYPSSLPADVRGILQGFTRQALHARVLGFIHPVTGKALKFESALPYDMKKVQNALTPYRA